MDDRAGARLDAVRRVADGVDPRLDPPGWCDYAGWIQCVVADLPANARLVEVGVWCGLSARHWARAIRETGRPMTIDVIDDWRGLTDAYAGPQADAVRRHIASHGSLEASTRALLAADADIVSVRTGSSLALAEDYEEGSLDGVFLDDDHATDHLAQEIAAWEPRVKRGGLIAGHDVGWPSVQQAIFPAAERLNRFVLITAPSVWSIQL